MKLRRPGSRIGTFDLTTLEIPLNNIARQYLDTFESLELKRDVVRSNNTQQFIDLTPNDQLYVLLDSLRRNPDKADKMTNELLATREFCNYVYMDDMAKDERGGGIKFLPGSQYFGEFVGDFTQYVAPIADVTYSQYEIDESKIQGVNTGSGRPSAPAPTGGGRAVDPNLNTVKNTITQLNSLIKTYHLGNEININDGDLLTRLTNSTPDQVINELIADINANNVCTQNN